MKLSRLFSRSRLARNTQAETRRALMEQRHVSYYSYL